MDTNNLIAWLSFDESATADKCGNSWTAYGTPTIGTDGAINGKALQLDGSSYLKMAESFQFTGQPFTIGCWFSGTSNTTGGAVCLWQMYIGDSNRVQIEINTSGTLALWKDTDSTIWIKTSSSVLDGQIHHVECDFDGATWYLFLDGTLIGTKAHTCTAWNYSLYVGMNYQTDRKFTGTIDEFQIYDGVALHTENFTPPTAEDYIQLDMELDGYAPISLDFDVERVVQNDAYIKPSAQSLKVWLPFNSSVTEDLCWNEWTIVGSLAIEDGALALESSSTRNYIYTTPPELGMSDFTIDWWEYIPASVNSFTGQMLGIDGTTGSNTRCLALAYWGSSAPSMDLGRGTGASWSYDGEPIGTKIRDQWVHRAVVRSGNTIYAFENGTLFTSVSFSYSISVSGSSLFIGNFARENRQFVGKLKNVRIHVGAALWTENFTPPTADDYIQLTLDMGGGVAHVDFSADVERKITNAALTWRYENPGDADDLILSSTVLTDLPKTKSITGTAFYQTQRVKCFDLPDTPEVWIKFDVYFDGSNRWRVFNGAGNDYAYNAGVTAQTTGNLSLVQNSAVIQNAAGICKTNQLQTVLLHMISGSTAGVIEAWVDGSKIYTYTGDVNHGSDFADLYLQSDGSGTFFSNVIISNAEIGFGEGWHLITFDFQRKLSNRVEVVFDVERTILQVINVPFIFGEHFNHYVSYISSHSSVSPLKIKLPKKSKVYLHADTINCNAIKIFSDTDATGTVTGDVYAALDECESVFIQSALSPQFILNKFMYWLKTHGAADLDGAINYCTGGLFTSKDDVISSFLSDLDNFSNFLRNYCGVNLDNEDTGAAIGSDAGGGYSKNAETIVPEPVPIKDWVVPEKSTSKEIEGLTVHFPSSGHSGTFTDAEKHILAGLNSVWIEQALLLIRKSCGLTFIGWAYSGLVSVGRIYVKFVYEENERLAYVSAKYNNGKTTELSLCVNMYIYEIINKNSVDGAAHSHVHLDRTLAHEFVHAVMAASIYNYENLPLFIHEGAAELIQGIDDTDTNRIRYLLQDNLRSKLETIFNTGGDTNDRYVYIAGYLFFRYLIKQTIARGSVSPTNATVYNLSISDSAVDYSGEALTDNTRQFLYTDITRTLVNTYDIFFDVALLSTVPVELFVDLQRTIITKLSLFPTNNTDYFSGGGSTAVTLPSQEVIPSAAGNTSGLQSIEITLAEQQLTDQVTVTGIIPFDIMGGVSGTYLDYDYDMCVEGVTQQGALYTADCCTNLDELLYTPLNYDMPNILSATVTYSETEEPEYIAATLPALASQHVAKIADALGLTPVIQFEDFYSSVSVSLEKIGGATYADLIRDIFGWSARVPTLLINAFIRGDKLFVIQRGYEKNVIDITNSNYTLPTFNRTLMRTYYSRQKFSKTRTYEYKSRKIKPVRQSSEIYSDSRADSSYNYDNDGLLKKSVTTTTNADGDSVRTETTYSYETLESGKKVLVKETIKKYVKGVLDETTEIKHTPLRQGMSHKVMTDEDGDIISEGVGQNTSDDRVTPYSQFQLEEDYETETETTNLTIEGLTLIDTSFPIKISVDIDDSNWSGAMPQEIKDVIESIDDTKGIDRLTQITEEIKWLNRRTQETVRLSLYNYPHLIDFNDKIILNDNEYFLANNTAQTTPRIFNEQNLTLVRWY